MTTTADRQVHVVDITRLDDSRRLLASCSCGLWRATGSCRRCLERDHFAHAHDEPGEDR